MSASTPKAWRINAEPSHGSSFKEYRKELIHETAEIQAFLNTPWAGRFIISAPKGFGKTLLLTAKSLQIREDSAYRIPSGTEVVDGPPGGFPELSREKLNEFKTDYDRWMKIWSVCIMIAAIQLDRHQSSLSPNSLDANCDPWMAEILKSPKGIGAGSIFTKLLDEDFKVRERILGKENDLAGQFRQIQSQTALFIDNADQFLDSLLEDQTLLPTRDIKYGSGRHKANDIWKLGQLGLVGAACRLHDMNHHVKAFCTVRREAMSGLPKVATNYIQILGRTVEIEYRREDLRAIFIKNIKLTEMLFDASSKDEVDGPMSQFFGPEYAQTMHTILDQAEPAFDFVLRHTFYRPRDLMMIGNRIAVLPVAERTPSRLKEIVREQSGELLGGLRGEMKSFFPLPEFDRLVCHITKNIMTRDELEAVEENYVKSLQSAGFAPSTDLALTHPFWSLCEVGMLGWIQTDSANGGKLRQFFVKPREIKLEKPQQLHVTKGWYLIHPALDNTIHGAVGDVYFQHFDNTNIIGNGNPWKEPLTSLFVLRGDICKFSRIMESEIYQTAIAKIYAWVAKTCQNLQYFEVSGGDSLLLIDKNPSVLNDAMRELKKAALEDREVPLEFRFAGAAGPVLFKDFEIGEEGKRSKRRVPTGLALRTASRLEPHAQADTLIVDEQFRRLASSSKLKFIELQQDDIPTLVYKTETGTFRVQKSEGDPPHDTKLFKVSFANGDER